MVHESQSDAPRRGSRPGAGSSVPLAADRSSSLRRPASERERQSVSQRLEIGGRRSWTSYQLDVSRVAIGLAVDGDRLDAEALGGLDDTARDLAAVGDQQLLDRADWNTCTRHRASVSSNTTSGRERRCRVMRD